MFVSESVVYPFGIEPEEVVQELLIEKLDILEEKRLVKIKELILYCPVESFDMRIHLRGPRIGVVVQKMLLVHFFGEVFGKLASVIR
jgi:hypothetical protein